jgi:hypothetical protein
MTACGAKRSVACRLIPEAPQIQRARVRKATLHNIKSLKAENGTPCLTLTADTRPIYRLAKERCNHRHVGKMRIEALDLVAAKSENGSQMFI